MALVPKLLFGSWEPDKPLRGGGGKGGEQQHDLYNVVWPGREGIFQLN